MFQRFSRDESGVAMGLAIMVMVIVGVMGAGLLVFVRSDLEAVIEVNQGQRAFDVADAGTHAAKQQLLGDKTPGNYDTEDAGCNFGEEGPDRTGEDWSPGAGGVSRSVADGEFTVTIQWLNPDSSAPDECVAPETDPPPDGTDYFKVVSTGTTGNATRRVEAIYETYNLDVPRAYYTPGDIRINGTACISQVSLFTLSDVRFAGGGNGCNGTGSNFEGDDLHYGDWNQPPHNTTARPISDAGVGAAGEIGGNPSLSDGTASKNTRDFDQSTSPAFVESPSSEPQDPAEITFPFDDEQRLDGNRLCDEGKRQGNYTSDGSSGNSTLTDWPADSSVNTVVSYEFTNQSNNHTLRWAVDDSPDEDLTDEGYPNCKGPIQEGTLVVKGGGFSVAPNSDLFRGVVVVRGIDADEESEIEEGAALGGKACLDGFINSVGPITIAGSVSPSSSEEVSGRPGFFGVRTWGWREMYE